MGRSADNDEIGIVGRRQALELGGDVSLPPGKVAAHLGSAQFLPDQPTKLLDGFVEVVRDGD